MIEEVEALDRGTSDELLAKRQKILADKVEEIFKKREAKRIDKEEEKHLKQDKEVQAQAPKSKEEKAGAGFMELVSRLGLGNINIGQYIKNVTKYSQHSSDSENTTTFKVFMRETKADINAEATKRKNAEHKLMICQQDITSLNTRIQSLEAR